MQSNQHGASGAGAHKSRLKLVFILTTTYMAVEAVGGLLTGSLALLADAGHMLTDAGALGLSLWAVWFAQRPKTARHTFGFYRTEILAALANALVLLLISAYILLEAWDRYKNPPEVMSGPMLVVAIVGLGINFVGMRLLASSSRESLNVKAAYLETLSDMLGSVAVIAAGVIIMTTGWQRADPIFGALIGALIVPRTWSLIKEAVHILMEGVPEGVVLEEVEAVMLSIEGVSTVHDLHVWTLTSGMNSLTAHICMVNPGDSDRTLAELSKVLAERFEIRHTTIQIEEQECGPTGVKF